MKVKGLANILHKNLNSKESGVTINKKVVDRKPSRFLLKLCSCKKEKGHNS